MSEEKADCSKCEGNCCKHVAIEIDEPEDKEDFEAIRWYVCHEGVTVYLDVDDKWCVDVPAKCKYLGENNKCKIYDKRPGICSDYSEEDCPFLDEHEPKILFKTLEDVDDFIKKKFG